MPVKKVGKKWEVNGKTYDTEEAANNAYKAYLAIKFGTTDSSAEEGAEPTDNAKEDKKEKKSKGGKKS